MWIIHLLFQTPESSISLIFFPSSIDKRSSLARSGLARIDGSRPGFTGFFFDTFRLEDPEFRFLNEQSEAIEIVFDLLVRLDVTVADQKLNLQKTKPNKIKKTILIIFE